MFSEDVIFVMFNNFTHGYEHGRSYIMRAWLLVVSKSSLLQVMLSSKCKCKL